MRDEYLTMDKLVLVCFGVGNTAGERDRTPGLVEATVSGQPSAYAVNVRVSAYAYYAREWHDITHLGDSGMNRMPTPRITGQINPMPTTVRQEPDPGMCRVPIAIQSVQTSNKHTAAPEVEISTHRQQGCQT